MNQRENKTVMFFICMGMVVQLLLMTQSAEATPRVCFTGAPARAQMGDTFEATLTVEGVSALYGVELRLMYDGFVLESVAETVDLTVAPGGGFDQVMVNRVGDFTRVWGESAADRVFGQVKLMVMQDETPKAAVGGKIEVGKLVFRVRNEGSGMVFFPDTQEEAPKEQIVLYEADGQMESADLETCNLVIEAGADADAPDTTAPYVKIYAPEPGTINPLRAGYNTVATDFMVSEPGVAKVYVKREGDTDGTMPVKTLAEGMPVGMIGPDGGGSGTHHVIWDGKKTDGTAAAEGNYYLVAQVEDLAKPPNVSRYVSEYAITVDRKAPSVIVTGDYPAFSPNADGSKDIWKGSFHVTEDSKWVTVAISESSGGTTIRMLFEGPARADWEYPIIWDGENGDGTVQGEGSYFIDITAMDDAGNDGMMSKKVTLDLTPKTLTRSETWRYTEEVRPETRIVVTEPQGLFGSAVNINSGKIKIDDSDWKGMAYQDGSLMYVPYNALAIGRHTVRVVCSDLAGNEAELMFEIEVAPPLDLRVTRVESSPFNPTNGPAAIYVRANRDATLTGGEILTESGYKVAALTGLDIPANRERAIIWDGSWNLTGGTPKAGRYTYRLTCEDPLITGRTLTLTGTIIADNAPPVIGNITITPEPPLAYISPGNTAGAPGEAVISFMADDTYSAQADVRVVLEDKTGRIVTEIRPWTSIVSGGTLTAAWAGTNGSGTLLGSDMYVVAVEAKDSLGNKSTKSVSLGLDTAGPTVTLNKPSPDEELGTLEPSFEFQIRDNDGGIGIDHASFVMLIDDSVPVPTTWDAANNILTASTQLPPEENVKITLKASDKLGNTTENTWFYTINATGIAELSFTSPADMAWVDGEVKVNISAEDVWGGAGISKVDFYINNVLFGTSDEAEARFNWNSAETDETTGDWIYPQAEYLLKAVATDIADHEMETIISVTVDHTPPVMNDVTIGNNGWLSNNPDAILTDVAIMPAVEEDGPYTWSFMIMTDPGGAKIVHYAAQETVAAGGSPAGLTWDGIDTTTGQNVADGQYACVLSVYDQAGHGGMALMRVVTADSVGPVITFNEPADGAIITGDVAFRAGAVDIAGADVTSVNLISKLESTETEQSENMTFDGALFNYQWTLVAPGDTSKDGAYNIKVTAADMLGNVTESDIKTISLVNAAASISNIYDSPDPFSPNTASTLSESRIYFTALLGTSEVISWKIEIKHYDDAMMDWILDRTLTGISPEAAQVHRIGPVIWDGTDSNSQVVADQIYTYSITVTPETLPATSVAGGAITVDRTSPVVMTVDANPYSFSPNNDGNREEVEIISTVTGADSYTLELKIYCGGSSLDCTKNFGDPNAVLYTRQVNGSQSAAPVFKWNGMTSVSGSLQTVPNGLYRAEITAIDKAGNYSAPGTVNFNVSNPPKIAVTSEPGAFSPNNDLVKDTAIITWRTDKAGYFTLTIYDEDEVIWTSDPPEIFLDGNAERTVEWNGKIGGDPTAQALSEKTYNFTITGRDAADPANICVPATGKIVIDVSPPSVEPHFPLEDEFVSLNPRIKLTLTDKEGGFDTNPADILNTLVLNIDGTIIESINFKELETDENIVVRAWSNVTLTEGEHTLRASITDLAGNSATIDDMRFVAIESFKDDFIDTTGTGAYDPEKWSIFNDNLTQTTVVIEEDRLNMTIVNNELPGEEPADDSMLGVYGVFDASRKRNEVEIEVEVGSGKGAAGILIAGMKNRTIWSSDWNQGNFEYYAGIELHYEVPGREGILTVVFGTQNARLYYPPVDRFRQKEILKVVYEDGEWEFYVGGVKIGTETVAMNYFLVGPRITGGDFGSGNTITAYFDNFRSNLVFPKIKDVSARNANPDADPSQLVIYKQDLYEITVTGTPWQKNIEGYLVNTNNPALSIWPYDPKEGPATLAGPLTMTEYPAPGSGVYKSGIQSADKLLDPAGYNTFIMAPFTVGHLFKVAPLNNLNFSVPSGSDFAQKVLFLLSNAVSRVTLENMEYYPEYPYLLGNEKYRITAYTRPGDWDIKVSLININAFIDRTTYPDVHDGTVCGPHKMMMESSGLYSVESILYPDPLDGKIRDKLGNVVEHVVAYVEYGVPGHESKTSENILIIGKQFFRDLTISNASREGAPDVIVGERVRINVIAEPDKTIGVVLFNPDDPSEEDGAAVGLIYSITENQPGSGEYRIEVPLKMLRSRSGNPVSRISAVALYPLPVETSVEFAMSRNHLDATDRDWMPPKAPSYPVIYSGTKSPQLGDSVSFDLTWTKPDSNEDNTQINDLAGYRVYRLERTQGQGVIEISAAAEPLILEAAEALGFSLNNTPLIYNGVEYAGLQNIEGKAEWLAGDSWDLIPLPFDNYEGLQPDEDVYACMVRLDLTGVLYGSGTRLGTIFTQSPRQVVERWIERFIDLGVAASGGTVDACTVVFTANGDGTFDPATTFNPLDYWTYTLVNSEPTPEEIISDTYIYNSKTFPYAVSAIDQSGNESIPSPVAALPSCSEYIDTAILTNDLVSLQTGFIQAGLKFVLKGSINSTNIDSINLSIANLDALSESEPMMSSIVVGPWEIDYQSGNLFDFRQQLSDTEDNTGREAPRLLGVLRISGSGGEELVACEGVLKTGSPQVREISFTNYNRPDYDYIRLGETGLISVEGDTGITLNAKLVNPDNIISGLPTLLRMNPVTLTESPSGSGHYKAMVVVDNDIDDSGQSATRVGVLIGDYDNIIDPQVPSQQYLYIKQVPELQGELAIQPEWIKSGWNFNSSYGIMNNSAEALENLVVSVSIISDGRKLYTASSDQQMLNASQSIAGTFAHNIVYLPAGSYTVSTFAAYEGYNQNVADAQLRIVTDLLSGFISTDFPNYISGETINIDYIVTNDSGIDLFNIALEMNLKDEGGTIVSSISGPMLSQLPSGSSSNGSIAINTPAGLDSDSRYTIELSGIMDSYVDNVADKRVAIMKEFVSLTGYPLPDHVIRNQEPSFNFLITNNTFATISDGLVSGIIVNDNYNEGDPILASFEVPITNLPSREIMSSTAVFSPVLAEHNGEYRIIIYFRETTEDKAEVVFESSIMVESCAP